MSRIDSIVSTPEGIPDPRPHFQYARVPCDAAELIEGHGIAGDQKGGTHQARQLNIMSAATLAALQAEGFRTGPGEMGEQIVVAGIDIDGLAAGARLCLGPTAVVEVVLPRTGCGRFEKIQGKPKATVKGRLGIMARVVRGGPIRVGDSVWLAPEPAE
jgi:MOSC domain-containing protein YiiM